MGCEVAPRRALLELTEICMLKRQGGTASGGALPRIHVLHTMPAEEKALLKQRLGLSIELSIEPFSEEDHGGARGSSGGRGLTALGGGTARWWGRGTSCTGWAVMPIAYGL